MKKSLSQQMFLLGLPAATLVVGSLLFFTMANALGPVCTVPGSYATIQDAINDPGCATINVAAGTYAEHVAVNRPVILNGANTGIAGNGVRGAESIVDGTDTGAAFAITANGVIINGFKIMNGSNGGLNSGIWIQTGTQGTSIVNNIITQNAFGVWAQCGGNCLIERNLFDANNKPGPGSGAISADNTTGLTISDNEFKGDTVGNPILLQGVAPGAHNGVTISGNTFHDNLNASVMYLLAIATGTISNNMIAAASDVTGISLSGANHNVSVMGNTITGTVRGVRIEDAGYYGAAGTSSAITINRNSLASSTEYAVGNLSGYTGNVDATCNWWGSATGPGPVGPGTGSPVTTNVDFSAWLSSSNLAGICNGGTSVTVTIDKFIDGVAATTTTATTSFPMSATWTAANLNGGTTTSASFDLADGTDYHAMTAAMDIGASYMTNEVIGSIVGATCAAGTPFALVGYTSGDTLAAAMAASATTTAPSFSDLQTSKYVIVWNETCDTTPPPPPTNVPTETSQCKSDGWMTMTDATGTSFKNQGDCVSFVASKGKNVGKGN